MLVLKDIHVCGFKITIGYCTNGTNCAQLRKTKCNQTDRSHFDNQCSSYLCTSVARTVSKHIVKDGRYPQHYGPIGNPQRDDATDEEDDEDCGEDAVHPAGFAAQ